MYFTIKCGSIPGTHKILSCFIIIYSDDVGVRIDFKKKSFESLLSKKNSFTRSLAIYIYI